MAKRVLVMYLFNKVRLDSLHVGVPWAEVCWRNMNPVLHAPFPVATVELNPCTAVVHAAHAIAFQCLCMRGML